MNSCSISSETIFSGWSCILSFMDCILSSISMVCELSRAVKRRGLASCKSTWYHFSRAIIPICWSVMKDILRLRVFSIIGCDRRCSMVSCSPYWDRTVTSEAKRQSLDHSHWNIGWTQIFLIKKHTKNKMCASGAPRRKVPPKADTWLIFHDGDETPRGSTFLIVRAGKATSTPLPIEW